MSKAAMFVVVMILAGCTFVVPRYSISVDNVTAARSLNGVKLSVGSFTEAPTFKPPSCNYKGPITTMDGESYALFIRNALVTDLKMADAYSELSPNEITGRLERIENSTATGTDWTIVLTIQFSSGRTRTLTEYYKYNGSIVGSIDSTCGASALAFVPAVQDLVAQVIREIPRTSM